MLPDIHQIQCFLAVAHALNYSRAAEEFHISRQAITKTIQRMEKDLGAPLFLQDGKQLSLTELGNALLSYSLPLLSAYHQFEDSLKLYLVQQKPLLHIAVSHGALLSLGQDILNGYHERHPELLLSIEETSSDGTCELVRHGEADIGLTGAIPAYLKEFDYHLLIHAGMWILLPADHPLAEKPELFPPDLEGQPIVGPGRHDYLHRFFTEGCRLVGIEPFFSLISSYSFPMRDFPSEQGSLYFAFPESILPAPEGMVVRRVRLRGDEEFGTYVITRKGTQMTAQARAFLSFLLGMFRQTPEQS